MKSRCYTMAWWHLITVIGWGLVMVCFDGGGTMIAPAVAADWRPFMVQAQAGQSGETTKPEGEMSVSPGMGKEAVRKVWGDPEEIRKLRTCFGWQEEGVYRGDPKRVGVSG